MFIVDSTWLAVLFCFVTMLCWGSWGNTQKLAARTWRYELFYWDYVIGMVLFALVIAFTMGSIGTQGRPFVRDIAQVSAASWGWIILGGIIFNASNILLSASTSIAGMSVAFPLGVGISMALGTVNTYIVERGQGLHSTDPVFLFTGVVLVVLAIICNGMASGNAQRGGISARDQRKGILLAIAAGVLMSLFYSFVARAMDLDNFASPAPGKATPYTAIVIFSLGVLLSNFVFNTLVMRKPFVGEPVSYRQYFAGSAKTHLVGMLGGVIWCLGTAFSYIASGKAGASVSYALGQGAPMIAAIWGVFIWKEFKGAPKRTYALLALMFCLFVAGLGCIIAASGKTSSPSECCCGERPFSVVFETDMGNDVDDALAFDLIIKEAEAHGTPLLAVGSHKPSYFAAPYVDMLTTWYGHPEIAIAESHSLDTCFTTTPDFTEPVVKMRDDSGRRLFARSHDSFEAPVSMYRRILSSQRDSSVVFLSTGMATELANLLDSGPDEISPLGGEELIARKVKYLSIMCGSVAGWREFNVRNDIPAMQAVFARWPGDIYITPYEIGVLSEYPASAIEDGMAWAGPHPVAEGYKHFLPMPYDRPVWDILAAAWIWHPEMFSVGEPGVFSIADNAVSSFVPSAGGHHYLLNIDKAQADALVAYIVAETTSRPKNRAQ